MKRVNIFYWVFTTLFALMMLSSSIPDIFSAQVAVEGMHKGLGYPLYFIPFIGFAKLLGVIAIVVPRFARLKEWAYAGLAFDLFGATYSIIASGGTPGQWGFMVIPVLLMVLSYVYYHRRLELKGSASRQSAGTYSAVA